LAGYPPEAGEAS